MNFALMLATLVALAAVVYGHPRRYSGRARGAGVRAVHDVVGQASYNTGLGIGKLVAGSRPIINAGAHGVRNGLLRGPRRGGHFRGINHDVLYRPSGGRGHRSGSISGRISVGGRFSGSNYY